MVSMFLASEIWYYLTSHLRTMRKGLEIKGTSYFWYQQSPLAWFLQSPDRRVKVCLFRRSYPDGGVQINSCELSCNDKIV